MTLADQLAGYQHINEGFVEQGDRLVRDGIVATPLTVENLIGCPIPDGTTPSGYRLSDRWAVYRKIPVPHQGDLDWPPPAVSRPLKDSGERREFTTGAVRDVAEGKGRPSLLPVRALLRLSRHFEKGCAKYGDRNWEKGIPLSTYYDSAFRHMAKHWGGAEDEDHLTAWLWNVICFLETQERVEEGLLREELDDRPPPVFV